ncbi:MAG: hypothetical protein IJF54_01565 [Clostridia bacterium]|nr:hypothetical protein [Clostridia bacterium]
MKKVLTSLLCVLLVVSIFVTHAMATTKPSTDESQFMPINGARLAAFGDSITEYGSYWQGIVAEETGATVVNCGKGGSNTGYANNHALERFDRVVAPQFPDFVTIMFGVNDAVKRTGMNSAVPLDEFEENIKTIISKVKAIGAIPILITEHHVEETAWYSRYDEERFAADGGINAYLDKYYDVERTIAQEQNIHIIDFTEELDKYAQADVLQADGVHFTKAGQDVLANCISTFLKENFPGVAPETSTKYTVTSATTTVAGQTTTAPVVDPGNGPKQYTTVCNFTVLPGGVNKTNISSVSIVDEKGLCAPDSTDTKLLALIPGAGADATTAAATYTFGFGGSGSSKTEKPNVVMAGDGLRIWINFTCDEYQTLSFNFTLHTYGDSENVTGAAFTVKGVTVEDQGQWVMIPYSAFTNSTGSLEDSTNGTREQRIAAINRIGISATVPTASDVNYIYSIYVDSLGYYTNVEETTETTASTTAEVTTAATTTAPENYENPYTVSGGFISGVADNSIDNFVASFNCTNGASVVIKSGEDTVTSGKLATGMIVQILQDGNVVDQFTVVIYGDIDGDGNINASDMLSLKRVLLLVSDLDGAYKIAANVTHKETVDATATDMLKLKRVLLMVDTITQ